MAGARVFPGGGAVSDDRSYRDRDWNFGNGFLRVGPFSGTEGLTTTAWRSDPSPYKN